MTNEEETPPAASSDQQQQQQSEKKKKKAKPEIMVPPEVATAYCIVRAAAFGVLGVSPTQTTAVCSVLQRTFLKQAGSAKFSINLGKKVGLDCALVALPATENETVLYDAIQQACKVLCDKNVPIQVCEMRATDIKQAFGDAVLDADILNKLKNEPETSVKLACIPGFIVCVAPGPVYESTGSVKIEIDAGQCGVLAGKKARKADLTLRFVAQVQDGANLATLSSELPDVSSLQNQEIRFEQGKILLEQQRASEAAEEEQKKAEKGAESSPVSDDDEMVVNIEEVKGKIDYNKLVQQFGSSLLTPEILERLQAKSSLKLHRFLRRGIFFSHRDMDNVIKHCFERQDPKPLYLYTGRGPSSDSMHLGHLIPFLFTKWLQDAFGLPLVIQMTDDEKFIFKGEYKDGADNLDHFARLTIENAKDIIACGFDYNKTFIFSDLDYVGRMYPNIVRIWKAVTTNTVNGIFGFDGSSNCGKVAFPAVQAAPSFATSFPTVLDNKSDMVCLIPCAIDQDPYFRMTRDIAHKLVPNDHVLGGKPALIHSKFFPPLQGAQGKMSSSDQNSAIFLTDNEEEIERKIKSFAYSGGQETSKLQKELGADLEADVSYQWLSFFLEDDEELEKIGKDYSSGSGEYWSTGKVKERLIEVLKELVGEHQQRRAVLTDDDVRKWMQERKLG